MKLKSGFWEKAPEGATHYGPRSEGWNGAWYRQDEFGNWLCRMGFNDPAWSYSQITKERAASLIPRPIGSSALHWNGEGRLPPAGTICEAYVSRYMHQMVGFEDAWRRVEVCKSGIPGSEGECLVFDLETTVPGWVDEFRPIRTPEQIAAEEREAAIVEMQRAVGSLNREPFATLYDLGFCRKKGGDV